VPGNSGPGSLARAATERQEARDLDTKADGAIAASISLRRQGGDRSRVAPALDSPHV